MKNKINMSAIASKITFIYGDECEKNTVGMVIFTNGADYFFDAEFKNKMSNEEVEALLLRGAVVFKDGKYYRPTSFNDKNVSYIRNETFAILGDSYGTYDGWIPEWRASYFNETNLGSVKNTWWWKLSKNDGMKLIMNDSHSGATFGNVGYYDSDVTGSSHVTRVKESFKAEMVDPDIIFLIGGLNDTWASVEIGECKTEGWTEEDLKKMAPSFAFVLDHLQTYTPTSRIIVLMFEAISNEVYNAMMTCCETFGVEHLYIDGLAYSDGHPTVEGMQTIYEAIRNYLQ